MRTLAVLLTILRDEIESAKYSKIKWNGYSMCGRLTHLQGIGTITMQEYHLVRAFLKSIRTTSGYWWQREDKESRIAFLNKSIESDIINNFEAMAKSKPKSNDFKGMVELKPESNATIDIVIDFFRRLIYMMLGGFLLAVVIFLMLFLTSRDCSAQQHQVTATVYHAVPEQTNSDPLHTASMFKLDLSNPYKHKIIAVSRDLLDEFPMGTKVRICGTGLYDGYYVVEDKMNKRWKNKIDILINEDMKIGKWDNVTMTKVRKFRCRNAGTKGI